MAVGGGSTPAQTPPALTKEQEHQAEVEANWRRLGGGPSGPSGSGSGGPPGPAGEGPPAYDSYYPAQ